MTDQGRIEHARWQQQLLMALGHTGRGRAQAIALEGRALLGRSLENVRR